MDKEKIKICVMREPGTNCDIETAYVFKSLGANSEVVHMNRFINGEKKLEDYHILVFPGGFSNSDHIRAGACWAKKLMNSLGSQIKEFVDSKKPILGICNGFQVLVETGLLPGFNGISEIPEAALATNNNLKFESRNVELINVNKGKCIFTKGISRMKNIPVAHAEGNFIISDENLKRLKQNDQIVFCYANSSSLANQEYPYNPNGSIEDIAGICNSSGTVFGMMPHPERAYTKVLDSEDGRKIFENAIEYVKQNF